MNIFGRAIYKYDRARARGVFWTVRKNKQPHAFLTQNARAPCQFLDQLTDEALQTIHYGLGAESVSTIL